MCAAVTPFVLADTLAVPIIDDGHDGRSRLDPIRHGAERNFCLFRNIQLKSQHCSDYPCERLRRCGCTCVPPIEERCILTQGGRPSQVLLPPRRRSGSFLGFEQECAWGGLGDPSNPRDTCLFYCSARRRGPFRLRPAVPKRNCTSHSGSAPRLTAPTETSCGGGRRPRSCAGPGGVRRVPGDRRRI